MKLKGISGKCSLVPFYGGNMEYKRKRYKFVYSNGNQRGIRDTNNLKEAIQTAINYQCEVIDTQTSTGNQIVFSAWDGWSIDWDFYNKTEAETIMQNML